MEKEHFVNNRTTKNKTKEDRLKKEHILPSNNIKFPDETVPFLKKILAIHLDGIPIKSILYSISKELLSFELLEYKEFDSGLELTVPEKCRNEFDLIGSVYQYLVPKYSRLSNGSFFTGQDMVEEIMSGIDIHESDTLLDPSCGSGNLLFNSKIKNPEQVIGLDLDELAIFCCKVNYYLKFGKNAPKPKIFCQDFCIFIRENAKKFDYVFCNPPFGATIDVTSLYDTSIKTEDSLTYFVEHSVPLAKKQSIFILPESVINVKKHTELRKWILHNTNLLKVRSFNSNFSGTMFPIVTLHINNKEKNSTFLFNELPVEKSVIEKMPFYYFRPLDSENTLIVRKVMSKSTQSLLGSSFGLGIVTGNNKAKVFDAPGPNREPVITGKDIKKFKINQPKKYLVYDRANFQQVAPDDLYRAPEKVIYKTVSRDMNFAIDNSGTLTLNSANFFIPKNLTISTKCLVALLNSDLYDKLNKLLYGENKISRTNLENLPLPDIDLETQGKIEKLADSGQYYEMNNLINSLFSL